jgi:hypothetical protein
MKAGLSSRRIGKVCGRRPAGSKAGRLEAANEGAATARPVRAVGDFDSRDPQLLDRYRHPEVGTREQYDLFFQGQRIQQAVEACFRFGPSRGFHDVRHAAEVAVWSRVSTLDRAGHDALDESALHHQEDGHNGHGAQEGAGHDRAILLAVRPDQRRQAQADREFGVV